MIRVSDVLHACVFVVCVAGGGVLWHATDRVMVQGVGYGLVVWIVLMLLYLAATRIVGSLRPRPQPEQSAEVPGDGEDDDTAFEFEDGKDD